MKSRSHEIECYNDGIALRFDGHLRSFAAELPVNYQNDWIQLSEYRLSWNRCQGCNMCFMKDFRCDRSRHVFHSYWTGNKNLFSEWFPWYAFRTEYFIPDAEMNSVNLENQIIIYYIYYMQLTCSVYDGQNSNVIKAFPGWNGFIKRYYCIKAQWIIFHAERFSCRACHCKYQMT